MGSCHRRRFPIGKEMVTYMGKYTLQPLTAHERAQAAENHNLVYSFLRRHGYDMENFYDVVIFGFLKGIQIYNRRKELHGKYQIAFICERYMSAEIGNHFRTKNAQKRKPAENMISLDADYAESENFYNCTCGKSAAPESEIIGMDLRAQLFGYLTESQRKIAEMKMDGYDNKEIFLLLEIKPSTYYKEIMKIKAVLKNVID